MHSRFSFSLLGQLCLPSEKRLRLGFSAPRGHLSADPHVEAVLQGLLHFGPQAVFLAIAPFRIFQLYGAKIVTLPNSKGLVKVSFSIVLFALQLAYILPAVQGAAGSLLIARHLSLVSYAVFCALSLLEHGRSVRPSTILTLYLLLLEFSDVIQVSLLCVAKNLCTSWSLPIVIFIVRLVLFFLEAQNKTLILREPYRQLAPEEQSGFLGTTFFWWVNGILTMGYSKILSIQNMPPLPTYLNAMKLRVAMQTAWDKRKKPEQRFALILAQFGLLWHPNLNVVIPRLLFTIFRYCQPVLIARTIAYMNSDLSPFDSRNEAFRLITFTFIIYLGMAVAKGMYDIRLHRLNVMSHMTIIGLIYDHGLRINEGAFGNSSAVTLMSNDAEQIMFSVDLFHELWSQSVELCIGMYVLAMELGWVCVIPLLVVAFASQGSRFVMARIANRQKAVSMATQERISISKAILDSMKNIKMMGLAKNMESKIQVARENEIKAFRDLNRLFVGFNASASILTIFSPAITLIIYALQAELRSTKSVEVGMAFTSLAIITMVTSPANTILTMMAHGASAIASFDRIQQYLCVPNREDLRGNYGKSFEDIERSDLQFSTPDRPHDISPRTARPIMEYADADEAVVVVNDVIVRPALTSDPVLRNINITLKAGSFIICSGAVGSGKTTLAKAILGDLPPDSGTIKIAFHSIAYCSQTPWLTNGTIQDVIQGPLANDSEIDEEWYDQVLKACDLIEDLHGFPNGDQAIVGSRGITLSGGQRHRLALARAVYARQGMIILDDVLSALDAKTESRVVNNLMGPKGLFKELGTTVLLITHSTQHLPLADQIIIFGEDGSIAEQGSWDELQTRARYIDQAVVKASEDEGLNLESSRGTINTPDKTLSLAVKIPDENLQDLKRKTGDLSLYNYYFGAIGSWRVLQLLASMVVYSTLLGLMPLWLRNWAEGDGHRASYYSGVYLLLSLGAFFSMAATIANIFLAIAPQSGRTLHARLLRTIMSAPQSFSTATDIGITLNRFSSDIQIIDRKLPPSILQVCQALFTLLAQFILLGVVQPRMGIILPFTFLIVYVIQKIYLATSRQLRYLDLETKASVISSFLETLEGVPTIRAFGWQHQFVKDNAKKLDESLRPWYLMMCLQRWLNVVMDLIILGIAMIVVSLAVCFKGTMTGGQIGIALNVVLQANMYLLRLVDVWTSLETSMGAISRVRAFEKDVYPEDKPGEDIQPPPEWPLEGAIDFDNMSAVYNTNTLALNSLTISIKPGQKVGICGRTGSGKSSQILSILRLMEIESGTIWIDGIDLRTLSRNCIRSQIITVPQDPLLVMSDTIRQNLDVAGSTVSDYEMIRVLKSVKLWSVLQSRGNSAAVVITKAQDLDIAMNDEASVNSIATEDNNAIIPEPTTACLDIPMKLAPLSQGQQQLFSLARAILMRPTRGKVVLLDEATSNVDRETDQLMQQLMKEEFKNHTILTVAHRLDTIMDSDIILVLDAGRLVEVGTPSELAERSGMFASLYRKRPRAV